MTASGYYPSNELAFVVPEGSWDRAASAAFPAVLCFIRAMERHFTLVSCPAMHFTNRKIVPYVSKMIK